MNGYDYVREALDIIEKRLASPGDKRLNASELASRIGYSSQHFGRLFGSLTGESPNAYIVKRRLTQAAKALLALPQGTTLHSLALDFGYPDYETFSRAFKRHFGVSPSKARTQAALTKNYQEALVLAAAPCLTGAQLEGPELVEEEEHSLAGLPFFMDDSVRSFHKPWATFCRVQDKIQSGVVPRRNYQLSSWIDGEDLGGLFIVCALEIVAGPPPPPLPFVTHTLPSSRYLLFHHRGDIALIRQSYQRIYCDFLARSEYRLKASWEFQRYGLPDGSIEIAIPLDA